jgi:hypothetical protein
MSWFDVASRKRDSTYFIFIYLFDSRDKTKMSSQWDMYQKAAHTKEIHQTNAPASMAASSLRI